MLTERVMNKSLLDLLLTIAFVAGVSDAFMIEISSSLNMACNSGKMVAPIFFFWVFFTL